ncbi:MAG: hypothetical protein WC882_04325 [Candidatus Gracilibacteria bacterium]
MHLNTLARDLFIATAFTVATPACDKQPTHPTETTPTIETINPELATVSENTISRATEAIQEKDFTPKEALEILQDQPSLTEYIERRTSELQEHLILDPDDQDNNKAAQIENRIEDEIFLMLGVLGKDQGALRMIIDAHLTTNAGNVAADAITLSRDREWVLEKDNTYFKELFENPKATPLVRTRAFKRIEDENYKLTKILEAIQRNEDIGCTEVKDGSNGIDFKDLKERASAMQVLEAINALSQQIQDNFYKDTKDVLERELDPTTSIWNNWDASATR